MRGVSGVAMLSNQFYERWGDDESDRRRLLVFRSRVSARLIGETDRPPKNLCLAVARPIGSL